MREWDTAAYIRKFHNTLTLMANTKVKGLEHTAWITEVTPVQMLGYRRTGEKENQLMHYPFREWEPVYKYIPAGFISRGTCLVRQHQRLFYVGINHQTHGLYYYDSKLRRKAFCSGGDIGNDAWQNVKLEQVRPVVFTMEDKLLALNEWGAISNRLFLSEDAVYYLCRPIGKRKGKDFDFRFPDMAQEVYDALREVL